MQQSIQPQARMVKPENPLPVQQNQFPVQEEIKFGIKNLKLTSFDPVDAELQEVLAKNQTVQMLEIGSLKNITTVPQQFPSSLKGVVLHEVPKNLVGQFTEKFSQLGLSQVWMDVWNQKSQESAPASQKAQLVSAVTVQ